jgi:hypothetical protein
MGTVVLLAFAYPVGGQKEDPRPSILLLRQGKGKDACLGPFTIHRT